jgi:hypothetical protein
MGLITLEEDDYCPSKIVRISPDDGTKVVPTLGHFRLSYCVDVDII